METLPPVLRDACSGSALGLSRRLSKPIAVLWLRCTAKGTMVFTGQSGWRSGEQCGLRSPQPHFLLIFSNELFQFDFRLKSFRERVGRLSAIRMCSRVWCSGGAGSEDAAAR